MDVQTLKSKLTTVANLNETPLSLHLLDLMKKAKVTDLAPNGLTIRQALDWAMEQQAETNPGWAEAVTNAAILAEKDDPAGLYRTLAESEPEMLKAKTLQQAASALMSLVQDLIKPDARAA